MCYLFKGNVSFFYENSYFSAKLHLDGHSVRTLRYLSEGDVRQDEAEDARRSEVKGGQWG